MKTDFEKALKKLPKGTGFDSFSHFTISDLCWICLHELDMHAEAENFVSIALRRKYVEFCRAHGYYIVEAERTFLDGMSVRKSDIYGN